MMSTNPNIVKVKLKSGTVDDFRKADVYRVESADGSTQTDVFRMVYRPEPRPDK